MEPDVKIGLEIHAQLNTATKLFCSCPTSGDDTPNSRTCPVCLGHPGSKPVFNKAVLKKALSFGLAINATIAPYLVFSRKTYFYPDMAKNYQITQYELPIASGGMLKLGDGTEIGITRAHLEEDPAASIHSGSYSLVDYNRSGNPLIEIVTEPQLYSPEQARNFMKRLLTVLEYLDLYDAQTGVLKADANISIRESGFTRAEIKNITGFKEIERALFYEVDRQKEAVKKGEKLVLETRGWDSEKGITYPMRIKETEEDYGYIIDPDLVKITISDELLKEVQSALPELADEKIKRFTERGVTFEDAQILAMERELAELFEQVAEKIDPVLAARWLRRELRRVLNFSKKSWKEVKMDETHLINLLQLVETKQITDTTAQKILEKLVEEPFDVSKYVEKEQLKVVGGEEELSKLCQEAIEANPRVVAEIKEGNEKAINFLVGQVMRKTKGRADPGTVQKAMKKLLQ